MGERLRPILDLRLMSNAAGLQPHPQNARSGIAAAGNWIVDRVKTVDHWPDEETLANIVDETIGNGGGAFNVLVDLARLGAGFSLEGVGLVGNDAAGDWVLERCRAENIGCSQISRADCPTSYTDVITVASTGRRTFFHQRGANAEFGRSNVRLETLQARIFYLGYALLLDDLDAPEPEYGTRGAQLLSEASRAGFQTAMDVVSEDSDRFEHVVTAAIPHLDWIFMNEFEAGRTVGRPLRKEGALQRGELEETASTLLNQGIRQAVILHAPEGALAMVHGRCPIWQPSVALPRERIAGTVGAGDAFAAGALMGLHEGQEMEECLLMGVCAAAASLQHASASDGMMSMDRCLSLGKEFGFQA